MKSCNKNHLMEMINLKSAMSYINQFEFEQYLKGLELSEDSIVYILTNPCVLNSAYKMLSKNPKLSLEEAVLSLSSRTRESRHEYDIKNYQVESSHIEEEQLFYSPPKINTMGNFIQVKGMKNGKKREIPFSSLPKKLQNLIGIIDKEEDFYIDEHTYEHAIERAIS